LRKAKKLKEAQDVEARYDQVEDRVYEKFARQMQVFKVEPFAGRKAAHGRAVLVELFTCVQGQPCVAAELALEAPARTYKPADVVRLEYHSRVPRLDPWASPESVDRQEYYGRVTRGTPVAFFDGKGQVSGGGFPDDARDKYREYRAAIEPLLEQDG